MSEPTPDNESSTDASDDDRMIPDDKLPDDLNPEINPLAREPDEDEDEGASPGPDAAGAAPGS